MAHHAAIRSSTWDESAHTIERRIRPFRDIVLRIKMKYFYTVVMIGISVKEVIKDKGVWNMQIIITLVSCYVLRLVVV